MGKMASETDTKVIKPKKKEKGLPTKLVIRRLPPTLSEEEFLKQFESIPSYDYFRFTPANYAFGIEGFTRAYINFTDYNDAYEFRNLYDGHLFYDTSGKEYSAVVECAPCQQVPRIKKKVDHKSNTIEQDADYIQFLENFDKEEETLPSAEIYIEELQARNAIDKKKEKIRTPLIDFLKEKRDLQIAARQEAASQREKERKSRIERDREKRREREKEKRSKYEKSDKKGFDKEKESKSEKSENKKEKEKDKDEKVDSSESSKPSKSTKADDDHAKSSTKERKDRYSKYKDRDDRYDKKPAKTKEKERRYREDKVEKLQKPEKMKDDISKESSKKEDSDKKSETSKEDTGRDSSPSKANKKGRPEIKIYRPPSERSTARSSDKRDSPRNKDDSKSQRYSSSKSNYKPKSARDKEHSYKKSDRYDKSDRYESRKSDRYYDYGDKDRSSSRKEALRKIPPETKASSKEEKQVKTEPVKTEKSEREKELEQERYRLNWPVKK